MHDISSLLKDTSHSSSNRTMSPRSSMNIQRALEGAIDSVLSKRLTPEAFSTRSTSPGIFSEAVDASVVSLKSILKTTKSLDYLNPIKVLATEQQPLTVATLNYDNVIETFCAANGLAVSNGLATWSKRFEVNKPHNTNLFLIKLHGSLDWELKQDSNGHFKEFNIDPSTVDETSTDDYFRRPKEISKPAIIFGQRDKLTADGPFLDLLRSFRDELFASDHLIVIGYSFRDPHINTYLRYWLARDPLKKITVIDPKPNKGIIQRELAEEFTTTRRDDTRRNLIQEPNQRLTLIESGAGEGLQQFVNGRTA